MKISLKLAIFFGLILLGCMILGIKTEKEQGINLVLTPPSFVAEAGEVKAFPEDEAGISAYVNTGQAIDLDKLKSIFEEVVEVGDNYIIGITNISNFGGDISVHVYADKNGWLIAYLTRDEPASKIMQWGTVDVNTPVITKITTTTLRDALFKAGEAAGVGIPVKIRYYDFEYPDANGMMIFVRTKATSGTNIVQVKIPADYILYEASYYHYVYGGWGPHINQWANSKLKVDGVTISSSPNVYGKWWRAFGSYKGMITTGQLHTIEVSYDFAVHPGPHSWSDDVGSAGVATVLIYRGGTE